LGKTAERLLMTTGIRPMSFADIDSVLAVEQASFSTPWSRVAFETEIRENDLALYLVTQVDNQIVGYAGMWIILDEAHITNVAVLPDHRGQGLGYSLMTAMMTLAKRQGATCMTLEVRVSNLGAQRLYRRMGFVPRGVRRQYYSDTQEDALIMWRDSL
jgi:[ribosomal protein S18]-alanine N-acetyltransferase